MFSIVVRQAVQVSSKAMLAGWNKLVCLNLLSYSFMLADIEITFKLVNVAFGT